MQARAAGLSAVVLVLVAGGVMAVRLRPPAPHVPSQRVSSAGRPQPQVSPQSRLDAIPTALPEITPPPVPTPKPPPFATDWLAAHPSPDLGVHGQALVLVDVDSREVLWERDAYTPRAPASLTKLVTAMVAADLAPLDREVAVTAASDMAAAQRVEPESTVMGLSAGEVLTLRDLLYGLFLRSGNDAAETIAGGIVERGQFIERMNQKAALLGMQASHFTSPVGLDDPGMRSTAYDLAVAAAAIVQGYPELLAISGTPFVEIPAGPAHKEFKLENYNKLLLPGPYTYPGATGMKTAFTDDAGPCMVATADRGGRRLVAVVLHTDNFFVDAGKLLNYGFGVPT